MFLSFFGFLGSIVVSEACEKYYPGFTRRFFGGSATEDDWDSDEDGYGFRNRNTKRYWKKHNKKTKKRDTKQTVEEPLVHYVGPEPPPLN